MSYHQLQKSVRRDGVIEENENSNSEDQGPIFTRLELNGTIKKSRSFIPIKRRDGVKITRCSSTIPLPLPNKTQKVEVEQLYTGLPKSVRRDGVIEENENSNSEDQGPSFTRLELNGTTKKSRSFIPIKRRDGVKITRSSSTIPLPLPNKTQKVEVEQSYTGLPVRTTNQ
ncbi:hypothetical protein WA026_001922 [Henosepilachna vigintioctopunctata]|uniref:Uncharacterized protein n=1 Tax=Henosepilachna vigintioctopunctata TaxID=420089 RepID=A0AAW1USB6_9CUCU